MSAVADTALMRFRPMQEADLAAVIAIEEAAYVFPWSEGIFRDCLRVGYSCWVLEQGPAVAGYGVMAVAAGECHILNLCVDPQCHRRGLGRLLLERLLKLAADHQAESAFLEVRPSNRPAIALYEKFGFSEVGIRRGYYPARPGREDALILALSL